MLETNKHPRSVCNIVGVGGGGVTTDEKGVYIQIQNIIVSSKALVLVNCLNTFAMIAAIREICKRNASSVFNRRFLRGPRRRCLSSLTEANHDDNGNKNVVKQKV